MNGVELRERGIDAPDAPTIPLAGAPAPRRWYLPSVADLLFVMWAPVVAIAFGQRLLNADGDPARHLRLGRVMLEQRALIRADAFSHTAFGRPFVPYEWGSEVLFAAAHALAGLPGVLVLSGVLVALTIMLLMRFMQSRGAGTLLAYLAAMAAALLTSPHWVARPHLLSFLGVAVLLFLLVPTDGRLRPWRFALLFAAWANLHPGFAIGLGLCGLFLFADALEWLVDRSPERRSRMLRRAACLGIALGACLLNPTGLGLLLHIHGLLGTRYLMDVTQEFQSPDFHTAIARAFLVVLLAVYALLIWRRERPRLVTLLVVLALTALALQSQRNIPLFGIAAIPLVALELAPQWSRFGGVRLDGIRDVFDRQDAGAGRGTWAVLTTLLLLGLALAGGRVGGIQLLQNRFDPDTFPVAAVREARAAGLSGRIFNEFTWGGYLLYAWPEQRVFIDGATDFYGEKLTRTYERIADLLPGWRGALDEWRIGIVLTPRRSALAAELRRSPDWRVWHEDATAVLLVRDSSAAAKEPGR